MLVKQSEKSSLFRIFLRNMFYIENIHLSVKGYPYWYVLTLWLSPIFTWVPIWKKWYDAKKNISKSAEHLRPQGENMRKNPIYKHEILKSVHRIARRGLSGHSINMTAMIQRKKSRYLVLKVWQQLAGFESSLNLAAASSVLPVRKTFTDLHRVIILLPLL